MRVKAICVSSLFEHFSKMAFASFRLVSVVSPTAEQKTVYDWIVVESFDQKGTDVTPRSGWSVPANFVIGYSGSKEVKELTEQNRRRHLPTTHMDLSFIKEKPEG